MWGSSISIPPLLGFHGLDVERFLGLDDGLYSDGCFQPKNRGGKTPQKWMVKIMENLKTLSKWMIWEVFPLFLETPRSQLSFGFVLLDGRRSKAWQSHKQCSMFRA